MSKVSVQPSVSKEPASKTTDRRRSAGERESDGIRIHISRRAYVVLYTIVLAPLLVGLGVFVGKHNKSSSATAPTQTQSPASGLQPAVPITRTYLNPGPWGTVEYVPFELTIPEE